MNLSDILLVPLPQSDGRIKNRPVVFLHRMPPFQDFLVCGVSTQLRQIVPDFDEIINEESEDFATSGLKSASVIRVGYLAVLPPSHFLGRIGHISDGRRLRLLQNLRAHLK